jgi:predicted Zn finger-like uncharacterized protein
MIITCASCLTKFNLDDSRIPAKGAKVRCSRCRHVFYVAPRPEPKGEIVEDFESFAKQYEELMEPPPKKAEISFPHDEGEKRAPLEEREKKEEEEEETFLFSERKPLKEEEEGITETPRAKAFESRRKLERKRGPSLIFILIFALLIIILGAFYLYSEFGAGGTISQLLESPYKRLSGLWNTLWGTEKAGLIVGGLSGYEEKVGEIPLYVIDGKVYNQSSMTKKYIKVKVTIYDQNKAKLAEKETACGNIISPTDLKKLPPAFFQGEIMIEPEGTNDRIIAPGKGGPFMVVFKDLPGEAKEFKVEIVEAPNL